MSWGWVTIATIVIIGLSAFFVAAEFALMSAKRHRLEEAAQHSAAGRAALKNSSELTLLLAGSQLGITICTLALGAITKPAVHHALTPLLEALGLPLTVADVAAFVLALFLVTFLHLVVGEMAPKSWAIAHPEKSAIMLSLPMRGFMTLTRPILKLLNGAANWLVRKTGSAVVDELSSGQDPDSLRHLVEHSANVGALDISYRASLGHALDLRELTVADVAVVEDITWVAPGASIEQVQQASVDSAHRRIIVRQDGHTVGVVHVRDTLQPEAEGRTAGELARPALVLTPDEPLARALRQMREGGTQLAVVADKGVEAGLLSVSDIMLRMLPVGANQTR
ncbi:hemolysin family protein [Propionibacteriaceae bacterium Y1923]|uniref:hemolysin family protein n=1 Tax=Aestuariimicrobium sp. Y1814 TaxID=3418742 RepID=UPI003C21F5A2